MHVPWQDARSAKAAFANRTQQCFAVKGAVNDLLDLARSTFCRLTEEIHRLADKYREEHALPHLKVRVTELVPLPCPHV